MFIGYPFVQDETYPINNTVYTLNNIKSTHQKSILCLDLPYNRLPYKQFVLYVYLRIGLRWEFPGLPPAFSDSFESADIERRSSRLPEPWPLFGTPRLAVVALLAADADGGAAFFTIL